MPLDHSNATVSILVTGPALSCYNPKTRNLEVGFIRHPRHILTIEVISKSASGQARNKFEIDDKHKIYLDAIDAIPPAQPLFVPGAGVFDRRAENNDAEDLRWIVDLDKEFNGGQPVQLKPPDFTVTPMFVAEPVLYAVSTSITLATLKLVQADNNTVDVEPFGKLANALGADIACRPGGGVRLRVEGPLAFSIFLPAAQGTNHEIVLDNTCPHPPGSAFKSDFSVYYSLVDDSSLEKGKVDFRPEVPDEFGEGAVCNAGFLGSSGQLFPLP